MAGNLIKVTVVPMICVVMHYSEMEYEGNENFYRDLGWKNLPVYGLVNLVGWLPVGVGFREGVLNVDVNCVLAVGAACGFSAVWFVRVRPVLLGKLGLLVKGDLGPRKLTCNLFDFLMG